MEWLVLLIVPLFIALPFLAYVMAKVIAYGWCEGKHKFYTRFYQGKEKFDGNESS